MNEKILAVRTDELKKHIEFKHFFALPREEIERMYASVEVLALDRSQIKNDPSFRPLLMHLAWHHNFRWFTYQPGGSAGGSQDKRSLLISEYFPALDPLPLFLDDPMQQAAARIIKEWGQLPVSYDLRLVGLLNNDASDLGRRQLGLVYVARLRQAMSEDRVVEMSRPCIYGNGELLRDRECFDIPSQILIDNLYAL